MYELCGAGGSSRREILSLNETNPESTCHGIQSHAGTRGAAADDENVERVGRTGADQRRPLDLPRRNDGAGVVDLLPDGGEVGSAAPMVAGRDRRVEKDCAAVCGGDGCSDSGAESPKASGGCHGKDRRSGSREGERVSGGKWALLFAFP